MRYTKIVEGGYTRFATTGRFTVQDGETVKDIIAEIKAGAGRHVVIDLSRLEFIDSSGIGMLLVINAESAATGRKLALITTSGQVRKVIETTQIGTIIPKFDSLIGYIKHIENALA